MFANCSFGDFRNWLDGARVSVLSLTHELPCVHRSESLRWEKSNEYACLVYFTLYYVYIPMKISRNELFEERTFESLFLFFIYIYIEPRELVWIILRKVYPIRNKRVTLRNFYVCTNFNEAISQFLPLNGFTFKKLFCKIYRKNRTSSISHFPN